MQLRIANPRLAHAVDDFTRKIAASRQVWSVAGAEGLARVASPTRRGREVTLFWSEQAEAERWASSIARTPRVKPIWLTDFLKDVLPKLQELHRAVGTNWTAEPCEPEVEPFDLARRIRNELVAAFVRDAIMGDAVFILEDDSGPTFAASSSIANTLVLPVWARVEDIEPHRTGFWSEMAISPIPIATLLDRTLTWLDGIERRVAPCYTPGMAVNELKAADLAERLTAARHKARFG